VKDKVYRTNPRTDEEMKKNKGMIILDDGQEEIFPMNYNLLKCYRVGMSGQGAFLGPFTITTSLI
jgi:hypothetical protein